MRYSWGQYSICVTAASISLLTGASGMHHILKPDTTIKFNKTKLENDKKYEEEKNK